MARYLINLSGDFDTGSLLPLFLPYLADNSLYLFEEITRSSLPESNQEKEILARFNLIKRHFNNNRLSLQGNFDRIEIGMIIGFEDWDFTGQGHLSRLPLFKVKYIRQLCARVFGKFYQSMIKQYYITGLKSKPYLGVFNHIEQTGYLPEDKELPEGSIKYGWLKESDIGALLPKNPKIHKIISESSEITPEMKASLVQFISGVKEKIETAFNNLGLTIDHDRSDFYKEFDACFQHIKYVKDYFKSDFRRITDSFIKKQFSLFDNLSDREIAFRYFLDETNVSKNLTSRIAFAELILESLVNNIFAQINLRDFKKIAAIEIDHENLSVFRDEMISFAEHNIEHLSKSDDLVKFSYKQYHLSDEDIVNRYPVLDQADYFTYKSHDNIRKIIGSYFDLSKRRRVREALAEKNIDHLEKKIFSKINEVFYTPDNLEVGFSKGEGSLEAIRNKLADLSAETTKLESNIDHDAYNIPKHDLMPLIQAKRDELIENISLLPRLNTIFIILGISCVSVFLFAAPLYNFMFPLGAIILAVVFAAITGLAIPITFSKVKGKFQSILMELEIAHEKLFAQLDNFRGQIIKAAIIYKNTVIRRKNIAVLEKIVASHEQENQQKHEYKVFLIHLRSLLADFPGREDLSTSQKKYQKVISDFSLPPLRNSAFTRQEVKSAPKRITYRYPYQEPVESDYRAMSFIKHIEFE